MGEFESESKLEIGSQVAKNWLKGRHRQLRGWVTKRFASFSPSDLSLALRRLEIARGDMVLVHSAWEAFLGFTGTPTDAISVLQDTVGPGGAILVPTMPFSGTAVDFARASTVVDLARAPSRMGLISEIFRRSPQVRRSTHPTHPVAVWGGKAREICDGHATAGTPCGVPSPFSALYSMRGKILLMGTGFEVLTFYHFVEELLEAQLPDCPFTTDIFELQVRAVDGVTVTTRTRLFEPAMSRRRDLSPLEGELWRCGKVRASRVGRLNLNVVEAREVVNAVERLAARGIYCYE